MLVDDGLLRRVDGRWKVSGDLSNIAIPPTIHALLAARLDLLGEKERAVIERASVVGRVFGWSAVAELSPPEMRAELSAYVRSLLDKELIRPEFAEAGQEDAFRFAHQLIRDAAYQAIPKAVRADLHERLADWFEARAVERPGEYDEILGHHAEQAYLALRELGPANERIDALAKRAAAALAAGGGRAFAQGDMPAAVNRLSRARLLLAENDPDRLDLLPQLAYASLEVGDFAGSEAVLAEATESARDSGDSRLQAHALVLGLSLRLWSEPGGLDDGGRADGARGDRDVREGRRRTRARARLVPARARAPESGPFRPCGGGLEGGRGPRPPGGRSQRRA